MSDDAAVRAWSGDVVVARAPSVYTVNVDGEAVLLDEASDRLHHLNAPAALVWACLDGHATVDALAQELSSELGEPYETVHADTVDILRILAAEGLLATPPATRPPVTSEQATRLP